MRRLRSASSSSLAWNWNGRIDVSPVGATAAVATMKGCSGLVVSGFAVPGSGVKVGVTPGVVAVVSTDIVDLLERGAALCALPANGKSRRPSGPALLSREGAE